MTGKLTFLSWFRFHRVHRFCPLILILLMTVAGIFQGCDDDDPVGPSDPTATPIPTTTPLPTITPEPTATPEPTETPEPTFTPMYNGAWRGVTWGAWSESEGCTGKSISFDVFEGYVRNGRIGFCVLLPYGHGVRTVHIEFEAAMENDKFGLTHQTAPDAMAHDKWTIEGLYDSSNHFTGIWRYYSSGPFGEGSYSDSGGWSAGQN